MNIKYVKKPRCFPYREYTRTSALNKRRKFKAFVYDDNGGMVECVEGKQQIFASENGNINDWLVKINSLIEANNTRGKQLKFARFCLSWIQNDLLLNKQYETNH